MSSQLSIPFGISDKNFVSISYLPKTAKRTARLSDDISDDKVLCHKAIPDVTTLALLYPSCQLALFGCPVRGFSVLFLSCKGKGKAVPLQAWSGPGSSRKLRFPDYIITTQDGGKIVSLKHRPPLPPRKYSWHSFLLEAAVVRE
jgi:hypothetical protein